MLRVLLVDEEPLISNIIATVLEEDPYIKVIGTAATVSEVLTRAQETDVILVNNQASERKTLELIKGISSAEVTAKIIALGLAESKTQVLQFVQAGAAGFVLKDASVDDLISRIRDINAGRIDVSPQIASALMSRLSKYSRLLNNLQSQPLETATLTTREMEILEMISQGLTNQQIASRLVIEVGTVKNHVHNLLQKMNVNTREEAAIHWAIVRTKARDQSPFLE
jgi:DNA-binding NarL/FixJ family response regulator